MDEQSGKRATQGVEKRNSGVLKEHESLNEINCISISQQMSYRKLMYRQGEIEQYPGVAYKLGAFENSHLSPRS